jgi:hypothetical protein
MFAVIIDVRVDPTREDEARRMLENMIVPKAKAHPGFLSGHWPRARKGDVLRSVHIFDTEDHARDRLGGPGRRAAARRARNASLRRHLRSDRPGIATVLRPAPPNDEPAPESACGSPHDERSGAPERRP